MDSEQSCDRKCLYIHGISEGYARACERRMGALERRKMQAIPQPSVGES